MKRGMRWAARARIWVVVLLLFSSCQKRRGVEISPPAALNAPQSLVVPDHGAYTGAYMEFGDREDEVTFDAIEKFENLVGKKQALVASSSYWGEQTFPTANVNLIWRHGSIPMIFWSPWDRPYEEADGEGLHGGPDKYSLTSIIEGKWDSYIDMWGDAARAFGQPFFVSFGNEMNGTWFPWSGFFYGAEKEVGNAVPPHFQGPETFKEAYRHVVDRVRARGATNVLWVFHLMNYSIPQDTWNMAEEYYPGAAYVDWLGISVYGQQYREEHWSFFGKRMVNGVLTGGLLDWPYTELCELDPDKPIMLAEWGVGEFPEFGSKADWITEAFAEMKIRPRIKAAVFWHERWQNEGSDYSNLRVNSSPESLEAYRRGVRDSHWLDRPILKPRP